MPQTQRAACALAAKLSWSPLLEYVVHSGIMHAGDCTPMPTSCRSGLWEQAGAHARRWQILVSSGINTHHPPCSFSITERSGVRASKPRVSRSQNSM